MTRAFQLIWMSLIALWGIQGNLPATADHGETIIILATDYPPFDIAKPQDGLFGHDHEVAVEAFKRQGMRAEIVYVPWSRAISDGKNGDVPAVLTCASNDEREEFFLFSDPISMEAYGIHYRAGFPVEQINTLSDLAGYSVAAVLEYATNADLENHGANIVDITTDSAGFRMLELGRVDFLYTGQAVGNYLLARSAPKTELAFKPFVSWEYHVCFSRKHPRSEALRQAFNAGLSEMKADGTFDAIHSKYR